MAIVAAFAGQAAMAINGVKLVQELQERRAELARKVDELEALREVGEAVSSSLDIDNVLATIAMHAVELSGTDGGSIMEYAERRAPLPGAERLPDRPERGRAAASRPHRPRRDTGRACGPGATPDRGHGPRRHRARPAPADPLRRGLAFAGGGADAARGPDRRFAHRAPQADRGLLARRRWTCWRPSPASRRWPCSTPSSSASSRSRAPSWRWPAGTSRSSWPACPTSCARRSTQCWASPRSCWSGCSATSTRRQEEYLRDIHSSGRHLLELLNEILDLSKVEAGRMELEYSTVDARAVLEYTVVDAA